MVRWVRQCDFHRTVGKGLCSREFWTQTLTPTPVHTGGGARRTLAGGAVTRRSAEVWEVSWWETAERLFPAEHKSRQTLETVANGAWKGGGAQSSPWDRWGSSLEAGALVQRCGGPGKSAVVCCFSSPLAQERRWSRWLHWRVQRMGLN